MDEPLIKTHTVMSPPSLGKVLVKDKEPDLDSRSPLLVGGVIGNVKHILSP